MLSDLGYALLHSDDRPAARLPLIQAAELAPDNRKVISNLALYLLLSGDRQKAESMMTQANIPPEVRMEIVRHAQAMSATTSPDGTAVALDTSQRTPHGIAGDERMQLQLQLQLLEPKRKSLRIE